MPLSTNIPWMIGQANPKNLTVNQMKKYLDQHSVIYKSKDNRACIQAMYSSLFNKQDKDGHGTDCRLSKACILDQSNSSSNSEPSNLPENVIRIQNGMIQACSSRVGRQTPQDKLEFFIRGASTPDPTSEHTLRCETETISQEPSDGNGPFIENLPPPATILEKSSWRQTEDFGTEEDSDGAMDEDSDILMNKTYDSVSNFKPDPTGVSKFRPDLCQGFTSPDNLFLWNLAFKSFIILVRCGEYRDISLDMFDEKEIWEALKNHVKNCLKRRFLEGMMDVDAQVAKAKAQRSQSQVTKVCFLYSQHVY
ncbi:hypothetical protein PPACK8108_LOCUS6576 [Phakopsora pachyrhizi]|uniref:Uncharacterized protein n=1 Tax=Phakopsora pachyrhizi TaxID=170000 RepID=A0AAV0AVG3_PHAPC|nr:hypothetical protein PPACK8108_LOCUS6576 [Phakopsora pachyrhizi]